MKKNKKIKWNNDDNIIFVKIDNNKITQNNKTTKN